MTSRGLPQFWLTYFVVRSPSTTRQLEQSQEVLPITLPALAHCRRGHRPWQ